MARKYLRIAEVVEICGVDEQFIHELEQEALIRPVIRRKRKLYSLEEVDRVRIARLLVEEMGVNMAGTEVALNMREQMIAMQRQFDQLLRLIGGELKK